jgi:hypothetical protein
LLNELIDRAAGNAGGFDFREQAVGELDLKHGMNSILIITGPCRAFHGI